MRKRLNKTVWVRAGLAFVVGFGIITIATPVGHQMEKVPLDRLGLLIQILE